MPNIRISTDSTADIPQRYCDELGISVLPLTLLYEGKEYRDGIDLTPQQMYQILNECTTLPVSAQVASHLYTELFERMWQEGCTDLIHVSINAKGSGTYQAGCISRDLFYEDHPEAKDAFHIHIMDSGTYSMGYGIPVIEAAQMVQKGAGVVEIVGHIRDWVDHARPLFVPMDLKCVKKSGRISPAAAFLGDAIGLKPLITFEDGEPKIIGKARGEQKAIAALVETCLRERKPGSNYAIVHGANDAIFREVQAACAKMDQPPMTDYFVGCVIGINTGPNMVGLIYRR